MAQFTKKIAEASHQRDLAKTPSERKEGWVKGYRQLFGDDDGYLTEYLVKMEDEFYKKRSYYERV